MSVPTPRPTEARTRLLHDGARVVEIAVETARCDACDAPLDGEPAGRGELLWTRGDERRVEEPALCEPCACAIGLAALAHWEHEEDGGD